MDPGLAGRLLRTQTFAHEDEHEHERCEDETPRNAG